MFKSTKLHGFNLQIFNDGGEGGQGGGEGGQGGTPPAGTGGTGGQGGQGGTGGAGEPKPFITFPDEQSFMSRVSREAKKHVGEFIKGLGFEKDEDLKALINAHKESEEAKKTELQKTQEALAALQQERDDALSRANKTALDSEARLQAAALGIKPERINHALKLTDLSGVQIADGKADAAAIKTALEAVISDLPELKGTTGTPKGGQDFSGGGSPDLLTLEKIKAMSPAEVASRLPEINAFLAGKK